jgi:serine/threonine-protein kinase HipA
MRTLPDGQVQLAPLADFAPMPPDAELAPAAPPGWLPGGLPGGLPRALACALRELQLAPGEAAEVAQALAAFAATVEALPDTMRDCGVDIDIIDACRPHIAEQARQLARLR